uniref:Uncharacterized protein n=1 Tax=Arundo donax TaxID=35708 RepID=A0A0A8Z7N7_ARUDO
MDDTMIIVSWWLSWLLF